MEGKTYAKSLNIRCAENGFIVTVSVEKPAMTMSESYYKTEDFVFSHKDIGAATAKITEVLQEAAEYYKEEEMDD